MLQYFTIVVTPVLSVSSNKYACLQRLMSRQGGTNMDLEEEDAALFADDVQDYVITAPEQEKRAKFYIEGDIEVGSV